MLDVSNVLDVPFQHGLLAMHMLGHILQLCCHIRTILLLCLQDGLDTVFFGCWYALLDFDCQYHFYKSLRSKSLFYLSATNVSSILTFAISLSGLIFSFIILNTCHALLLSHSRVFNTFIALRILLFFVLSKDEKVHGFAILLFGLGLGLLG